MELVTARKLAEKLQIHPRALIDWRQAGFLIPATTINHTPHYTIESIDEILRRGATNLNYAVSATDILLGKVTLLTVGQAAEKLGTHLKALHHRIERGRFPAIKLRREWRIIERDVDHFLARSNNPDYIPREKAAHIFGSNVNYIKVRIQCGDLRCVTIPKKPVVKPVTLESILALLRKIAPPWVDPEVWVAERQEDDRPLISLREFERFLGISIKTGLNFLRSQKVAYLQIEGGMVKVSPVSADHLLAQQDALTLRQIANLFGVDERTAAEAWRSRALQCNLHSHTGNELRRACVVEILSLCLSPGAWQTIRWYERRLNNPQLLLSVSEAAVFFKISEEQIITFLQSGKLQGVKLPGPNTEWRIEKNMR